MEVRADRSPSASALRAGSLCGHFEGVSEAFNAVESELKYISELNIQPEVTVAALITKELTALRRLVDLCAYGDFEAATELLNGSQPQRRPGSRRTR